MRHLTLALNPLQMLSFQVFQLMADSNVLKLGCGLELFWKDEFISQAPMEVGVFNIQKGDWHQGSRWSGQLVQTLGSSKMKLFTSWTERKRNSNILARSSATTLPHSAHSWTPGCSHTNFPQLSISYVSQVKLVYFFSRRYNRLRIHFTMTEEVFHTLNIHYLPSSSTHSEKDEREKKEREIV